MTSPIPLSNETIIEVLRLQSDRFSDFSNLLDEVGLTQSLSSSGKSWTLLAPTNAAFSKLPEGTLDCLHRTENRGRLQQFILLHISSSVEYSSTLSQRCSLRTRTYYSLLVTSKNDTVSLTRREIMIEELDIPARNGVIHVLPEPIVAPTTQCP